MRVAQDEVTFPSAGWDSDDAAPLVTVKRGGQTVLSLKGTDVDLDRSQGDIGLFVPDAGYPFGVIPDWLVRQRARPPGWVERGLGAHGTGSSEPSREGPDAGR